MENQFPQEGRTKYYQNLRAWAAEVEERLERVESIVTSEPPAQPKEAAKPRRRGKDARDDSILDITAEEQAVAGTPGISDDTED